MRGDNVTDGIPKGRPALGDITNGSVKRGFLSISENLGFKSEEEAYSQFAKQVRKGVEKFMKENPKKPQPKENLLSVNDKFSESKEGFELSDSDDTLNDKFNEPGVVRLASSKGGCIDWSRLPKSTSKNSQSFELERCVGLKNDSCNADSMLKACSCSFCLKAAYIWSDLHYQDIKGRIAGLKKSQKEARILVQKSGKGKQTDIHEGNKSSNLESDLTSQWRSLFLSMEDIFVHEGNHLQTSYTELSDLREKCKIIWSE